ncbi:hypothetical protein [Peribacillus loiseleuriae]|uniref:hypothetical protein n=1 Tax=Peribacillus loiseleuriae TaxID=1679170 RepID=UPI003D083350
MVKTVINFIFILTIASGCVQENMSTNEEINSFLKSYFNALEKNDIESMVELSVDKRFSSKDEQKENYLSMDTKIKKIKLIELDKKSNSEYEALISFTDEKYYEITLPIIKKGNKWMAVVGNDL